MLDDSFTRIRRVRPPLCRSISPAARALRTQLVRRLGIGSRVVYFNQAFAPSIAPTFYRQAAATTPLNNLMTGMFREAAFGP